MIDLKKHDILRRIAPSMVKELEDIKIERIKKGKDTDKKSDRRLTIAITRHPDWPLMKKDIINAKLEEEIDD
jgi:hypothetical protein